jgi:hypothetical protein
LFRGVEVRVRLSLLFFSLVFQLVLSRPLRHFSFPFSMSPSPPLSPASDSSSVIIIDDPEERINPPARTSLAARFRNLTRTSPSPSPEPIPPPPPPPIRHFPCKLVTAVGSYRPIVSRNANNRPRVRASQVRSCDQCRTSKQKVFQLPTLPRLNLVSCC